MQKFASIISLLAITTLAVCFSIPEKFIPPKKKRKHERIEGAVWYTKFTSSDINTGEIPMQKQILAIQEGQRRLDLRKAESQRGGGTVLSDAKWRERGPNNRGGRTRAIMIDEKDSNRNRIWIGGVSGGVWRTEDITQNDPQWEKLGIYFSTLAISDIKQDPNALNTIYVSTGESYTGDVPGGGIFKSTDDGETWEVMPSTTTQVFRSINELFIHPNGHIYAASSSGGLLRSTDNGVEWQKVLGSGLSGTSDNNIHDFYYHEPSETFFASNAISLFTSKTGDRGDWEQIGITRTGFPTNLQRVEFSVCYTDPRVISVIGNINSFSSNTFNTTNGGETWVSRAVPAIFNGGYGQAWYDLDIAVDPSNCFRMMAGGVDMARTTNQATGWGIATTNMHVDHHNITYDPKKPGRVLFGNDGGIWISEDYGQTAEDKSQGYVTTQFYACAIHPDPGSPYIIGGTQDNNSLIIEEPGLSPSRVALGGDGAFCHIDQDNPDIQIVSFQEGNYYYSTDGGLSFQFATSVNGSFINRSAYDSRADIMYGQVNQEGVSDIDFFRWPVGGVLDKVDITGRDLQVSAVFVDPEVENRMFFGGQSGIVVRVDNAHQGTSLSGTVYADLPANASVSSIYIDKLNPQDGLISLFNYGDGLDNIWMTSNDGAQWISIEGDLPDLPVRWAMFDPTDHNRAMLATDAGIWTTEDIDGDNTKWMPASPDNGMPFVRVDMLVRRESDNVILAATYGRGMMTTDVFSAPRAIIVSQNIVYEGQPVTIDGTLSVNAQSYNWDFGDNTSSTNILNQKTYNAPGIYNVSLTINGNVTVAKTITVLPYLVAPYEEGISTEYRGDFENTDPLHFAANNLQGTPFQRGNSTRTGKDGTHSGTNAWVTGLNEAVYQNSTNAELYTPMYDLTQTGLYGLRFWSKFALQHPHDGFQIEYTIDGGQSWLQLGSRADQNWYNYENQNLTTGGFPVGKSYFTGAQGAYKQYVKDISFLAGQAKVAFRYVFRTNNSDPAQGLVIDDFEIYKFDGELQTTVTEFTAEYTDEQEVTVKWTTGIEYQARELILERSYNGFTFEEVNTQNAKGVVSIFPQNYEYADQNLRNVIYYRLFVKNENVDLGYNYEFYTDTIVVRRDVEPNIVQHVLTNPFSDKIFVSFSSAVDEEITIRLFDITGKLLREDVTVPNAVSYIMSGLFYPPAVYVLNIQIGDQEAKSYKLYSRGI